MTWTKSKGLHLNGVMFVFSVVFLCTLHQPTVGGSVFESLPTPHIEEDFGKSPTEEPKDPGGLGEPNADFQTYSPAEPPNLSLEAPAEAPAPFPASPPSPEKAPRSGGEYPRDLFSLEERRQGWVILHIIGTLYMFVSLAVVCKEFFVPAVAVITDKLEISEDVAGATVMAAGRSVPKFLAFLVGVLLARSRVGIGAIVGSAVYNVVFVTGMCALLARRVLLLSWWPLLRDVSFYVFHLVLLLMFFSDGVVTWWESVTLVGCYAAYVVFMKLDDRVERALKTQLYKHRSILKVVTAEARGDEVDVPAGAYKSGGSEDSYADEDDSQKNCDGSRKSEDEEKKVGKEEERREKPLSLKWPDTRYERAAYLLLLPAVVPLWLTLPDVRKQKSRKFFVITFLFSILWIIVISYFALWFGHQVGETFGVPHPIVNILVSAAANPDLITSVIVARKGLGDMAVSSSVGSNIFDITVGLPVSWLLFSSAHGWVPVPVSGAGLACAGVLHFLMLLLVVILIPSSQWRMSKVLGFTLVLLYVIFLVISAMLQHHIIVCPVGVGGGP